MLRRKFWRKPKLSPNLTCGAWVFSSTSFCPVNCPSRATLPKRPKPTSSMSNSNLSGCTMKWPWRPPGCWCGSSRGPPGKGPFWRRCRIIAGSIPQITCSRRGKELTSPQIESRNSRQSITATDHTWRWTVPVSFPN